MHLKNFFLGLFSVWASIAWADCAGCRATRQLILFPEENPSAKGGGLRLAWNFKGLAQIDYPRMLEDSTYAASLLLSDENIARVTNYLTGSTGYILAEIPAIPGGGIYAARGFTPEDRKVTFWEDAEQGLVYFQLDSKRETKMVKIFKKTLRGRVREVTWSEIKEVGVSEATSLYRSELERKYSQDARYQRDRAKLLLRFESATPWVARCKEKGAEWCWKMKARAEVPKGSSENFSDETILVLGVSSNWWGNHSVKVIP